MNRTVKLLIVLSLLPVMAIGQEDLSKRAGTFEILSRTDYSMQECGFTKTEMAANLEKIKELVAIMRKNPVLSDIRGFNGRARIYTMTMTCSEPEWYGVPARISFEFSTLFYSKEGKVAFNTIEPPEWSLYTNDLIPGWSDSFNSHHGYFTVALNKETIEPGIDVYDGECWVLYDPARADYWLPVTVREAWAAVWEEFKKEKDPIAAKYMKDMLDQEYATFTEADMDKPAYFGGNLSRISVSSGFEGEKNLFPHIMKANPAYFNRNIPNSSIQFIWFRSVQNKQYMKQRLDECQEYWKKQSGSGCDLSRFQLSFGMSDIRNLTSLIGE